MGYTVKNYIFKFLLHVDEGGVYLKKYSFIIKSVILYWGV